MSKVTFGTSYIYPDQKNTYFNLADKTKDGYSSKITKDTNVSPARDTFTTEAPPTAQFESLLDGFSSKRPA